MPDILPAPPPTAPPPAPRSERCDAALANVSSTLWSLRELLELLTFKLEEEQLLLASGKARWLGRALHEVELVVEEIRHAEIQRSVDVSAAAEMLGLPAMPSLQQLAVAAGEPWREIFSDHRAAFLSATAEISAAAETSRDILMASYRSVQQTLSALAGDQTQTYTAAGAAAPATRSRLFDAAV